jgi:hypothetical protein
MQCEAWGLLLADGEDPGLVDVTGLEDEPASAAECREAAAYRLRLDERQWSVGGYDAVLCVGHTAKIRSLPHGGIVEMRGA